MVSMIGDTRLPQRFWDKVEVSEDSGCWEWTARRSEKGYGQIIAGKKVWQAHRWSFTVLVGDIPDGLVIGHQCDNPCCVNPNHFEVITQEHNSFIGWGASALAMRDPLCKNGHEKTIDKHGVRTCIPCRKIRQRNQQRKQRAKGSV